MKILLLGKNGQVGWELQRALSPLGDVISLDRQSVDFCGDIGNINELRATIRKLQPTVIVNAAAYTAVDKAEADRATAQLINAGAVQAMAQEAVSLGALLVHYSTDYVFPGTGVEPWTEEAIVAPVNFYGESKLAGERAIIESGCKHLIFRTSWVYAARGSNFAKTMLRLGRERESLNVIADQIGAPTGADLIADISAHVIPKAMINPALGGLYHLAASGETSWCEYAKLVIETAKSSGEVLAAQQVLPIQTSQYPTPANRPLNSRLNTTKLRNAFSLCLPDWKLGVRRMLTEILNK
jgi:dTDP-4-dehydrorhamnose reductase